VKGEGGVTNTKLRWKMKSWGGTRKLKESEKGERTCVLPACLMKGARESVPVKNIKIKQSQKQERRNRDPITLGGSYSG